MNNLSRTHSRLYRVLPTAVLAVAAVGAAAVLSRVDPNQPNSVLPPCPLYTLTGLFCPGCGSTRCLHALVHGDVLGALSMNPLLVIVLPVMALMALSAAGWNPDWLTSTRRVLGNPKLWLWTLCGYWVARNLPWLPFNWLAPV